jgi:hypothetical protein
LVVTKRLRVAGFAVEDLQAPSAQRFARGSELTGTRPTQLSPSAPAVDIRLLFSYTEVWVKLQIGGQEN